MKSVSLLIKPASSLCNMRCEYCFYADVAAHRNVASHGIMDDKTRSAVIGRALEVGEDAHVTFAFQGGEPTCAGLEFFKEFVKEVDRKRTAQRISYSIQTNGLSLDEQWAAFFAENGFLVGVSVDGPRQTHDRLRPDAAGKATHERIMRGVGLLREAGVDFNVLTVLTSQLVRHPQQLYRFYRQAGFDFVQLIPCLPGLGGDGDEFSLGPHEFASFYKVFFRLWFDDLRRGQAMNVTLFDNVALLLSGRPPQQCGMSGRCTPQFVVESSGDVYPCDFYVLDEYRMGNVRDASLVEMAAGRAAREFLAQPRRQCASCADCPFEDICHRNCKRLSVAYYDDEYCGYREFLEYAVPRLLEYMRGAGR